MHEVTVCPWCGESARPVNPMALRSFRITHERTCGIVPSLSWLERLRATWGAPLDAEAGAVDLRTGALSG